MVRIRARARTAWWIVGFLFFLRTEVASSADGDPSSASFSPTLRLRAVPVSAYRLPTAAFEATGRVEVRDAEDFRDRSARTLGELLEGMGGLLVLHYGPFGALETVQLNGLGAGHATVRLEGVPLNSPLNGLVDLSLWPATDLAHAEVASGGLAALYGSDASAGAILLRSAPIRAPEATLRWSAGSFGLTGLLGRVGIPTALGPVRFSGSRESAQNDFPYRYPRLGNRVGSVRVPRVVRRRWNNDVRRDSFALRWEPTLPAGRWSVEGRIAARELGVPGAATGTKPDPSLPRARQEDRQGFLTFRGELSWGRVRGRSTLWAQTGRLRYRDPKISVDGRHRWHDVAGRWEMETRLGSMPINAGAELERWSVRSTNLPARARRRAAGWLHLQIRRRWSERLALLLEPTLRWDGYSDFGSVWSPRVGVSVGTGRLRAFGQIAWNFRAPTFNDLYWQPGGNPDLRPERSVTAEWGLRWRQAPFQAELAYRWARLRDQIRWLPDSAGIWRASNLDRSEAYHWNARLAAGFRPIRVVLRGAWQDVRQRSGRFAGFRVPFVPRWLASADLVLLLGRIRVAVQGRGVGSMPTRVDERESLGAVFLLDGTVRVPWRWGPLSGSIRGTVRNLLNRDYDLVPQYPMPGRSWELTLSGRIGPTVSSLEGRIGQ